MKRMTFRAPFGVAITSREDDFDTGFAKPPRVEALVSVDADGSDAAIRKFVADFKMDYTIWRDPGERQDTDENSNGSSQGGHKKACLPSFH